MDTRQKIISADRLAVLLADGSWTVVVGRFDPLTAVEAERLAQFAKAGKVLGIILQDKDALLPVTARAVLVASLRDVSAVLIADPENWETALPAGAKFRVIDDSLGEGLRRKEFMNLVLSRLQST